MSRYLFDINQAPGLLNPAGGESGASLLAGLNNNFDELYKGTGNIYSIQVDDDISDIDWWTAKKVTYSTFSVINNFDFGGETIVLPEGIILLFNGGVWSNGIVHGDNTKFFVFGLQQCFETDLSLTGKWDIPFITPQYYGAVTNENISVLVNDCSAAIQKCVDSLFTVFLPSGYYYISTGIIITIPKTIVGISGTNKYTIYRQDHTRIYTDQDIDLITIRSHGVHLTDYFVLDSQNCAVNTGAAVRLDLNYPLYDIKVYCNIQGNETAILDEGNGIIGIYYDQDHLLASGGFCSWSDIKGIITGVKHAIYVPQVNGGIFTWNNYFNIDIDVDGSKQAIRVTGSFDIGRLRMRHQSRYCLTVAEKASDFDYAIYHCCGSTDFDIFTFDLSDSLSGGRYTNGKSWYDFGSNNNYVGQSRICYFHANDPSTQEAPSMRGLINPVNLHLNHRGDADISMFKNELVFLYKRYGSYTINAYDGTGYDFDVNLDPSIALPPEPTITINNPTTVFDLRQSASSILFNDPTKYATGFVEIVFPWSIRFALLNYLINERWSRFMRIQTILKETGGAYYAHNVVTSRWDFGAGQFGKNTYFVTGFPALNNPSQIIIRFIGYVLKDSAPYPIAVGIHDIFMAINTETTINQPIIDIGGGQRIWGNIRVDDGVKETSLPVYADNAAAKVGGLVAGDPYRTSTGVRMVVYD